mmetsp:Transcript_29101/g.59775  ORF Transcript_29101/g.59775 Transcript_29101/m.59775 type:complete len:118 (-) Transcript_29101:662-1015(-)
MMTTSIRNSATLLWEEVAAIISGLIGGGRYGLKIRVPHAFVMTFLFGSHLSFKKKIITIAKLAAEHATNLASFACLYKFTLAALKLLSLRIKQSSGVLNPGIIRQFATSLAGLISKF